MKYDEIQSSSYRKSQSPKSKDKFIATFLALFLGGLGIHKFYLDKQEGIYYLLFCWTFIPAIIAFIVFIVLLSMSQEEFDSKYNNINLDNVNYDIKNEDKYDQLEKLKKLFDKGILTKEEYQKEKTKILKQ